MELDGNQDECSKLMSEFIENNTMQEINKELEDILGSNLDTISTSELDTSESKTVQPKRKKKRKIIETKSVELNNDKSEVKDVSPGIESARKKYTKKKEIDINKSYKKNKPRPKIIKETRHDMVLESNVVKTIDDKQTRMKYDKKTSTFKTGHKFIDEFNMFEIINDYYYDYSRDNGDFSFPEINKSHLTLRPVFEDIYSTCLSEFVDKWTKSGFKLSEINTGIESKLRARYEAVLNNYLNDYYFKILERLQYLDKVNKSLPKQRTSGWFNDRMKKVTASEAKNAMNIGSIACRNVMFEKIGIPREFFTNDAILHGVITEDFIVKIYEMRVGVLSEEYGCLPHDTNKMIGASPDGIIHGVNDTNDFEQMRHIGRMMEIKCVSSRVLKEDSIKLDYYVQMQMQMQTAGLHACEFIEVKIESIYDSIDELLGDKVDLARLDEKLYIGNHNIPMCNLGSNGMEKCIQLHFRKDTGERVINKGEFYPPELPYKKDEIEKWCDKKITEYENMEFEYMNTNYLSVREMMVRTVLRDDIQWNFEFIPKLEQFWKYVEKHKKMTDKELLELYECLEVDENGMELTDDEGNVHRRKLRIKKSYSPSNFMRVKKSYSFNKSGDDDDGNDSSDNDGANDSSDNDGNSSKKNVTTVDNRKYIFDETAKHNDKTAKHNDETRTRYTRKYKQKFSFNDQFGSS